MQLSIEIPLKTYEVYKLFRLKIGNKRFFIEAVLRKLNTIYMQPEIYQKVTKDLLALTDQFTKEAAYFEKMLNKKPHIQAKNISVNTQFHPRIMANNKSDLLLVEFIQSYDKLIATVKLLHLAGCFESKDAYYANFRSIQKIGNRMFSQILLLPREPKNIK